MHGRLYVSVKKQYKWIELEEKRIRGFIEHIGNSVRDEGVNIMKEEVPVRDGELRDSIEGKVEFRHDGGTVRVYPTADHAKYVDGEGRTAAHIIRPRARKRLRFFKEGAYHFARVVYHPGSKRTPFTANTLVRLKEYADQLVKEIAKFA